jgi:hypothetical protein
VRYWVASVKACYRKKAWLQLIVDYCGEAQCYDGAIHERRERRLEVEDERGATTSLETHDQKIMNNCTMGV